MALDVVLHTKRRPISMKIVCIMLRVYDGAADLGADSQGVLRSQSGNDLKFLTFSIVWW